MFFFCSFGCAGIRTSDGTVHEHHEEKHRRLRGPADPHLWLASQHERHSVNGAPGLRLVAVSLSLLQIKYISTLYIHTET